MSIPNFESSDKFNSIEKAYEHVDKLAASELGKLNEGAYSLGTKVENPADKIINNHLNKFDNIKN